MPLTLSFISFVLLLLMSSKPIMSSLSLSVLVLVMSTILFEWIKGSYRLSKSGIPWFLSFFKLILSNRKKYGGYIVHISILLVALGVIGINFYQLKIDKIVSVGEKVEIGNYKIKLLEINEKNFNDRSEKIAIFSVSNMEDKFIGNMEGNNTFYPSFNMASIRAAINSSPIEDLYIIPSDFIDESKMKLIISINPFVWWMWIGGPVFILGTIISLWPTRSRKDY